MADTGLALRYRFAGREYDAESGLYYMRARYYDPTIGRWLSEDPIGLGGGANLYAYAGNDPINAGDPAGTSYYYNSNGQLCEDWANVTFYTNADGQVVTYTINYTYAVCESAEMAAGGAGQVDKKQDDCNQAVRAAFLSAAVDYLGGGFRLVGALRDLSRSDALVRAGAAMFRGNHGLERGAQAVLAGSGFHATFEGFALRSAATNNLLRGTVGIGARATIPSVPHPLSEGLPAASALIDSPSGQALYNVLRALPLSGTGVRAWEAYQACFGR